MRAPQAFPATPTEVLPGFKKQMLKEGCLTEPALGLTCSLPQPPQRPGIRSLNPSLWPTNPSPSAHLRSALPPQHSLPEPSLSEPTKGFLPQGLGPHSSSTCQVLPSLFSLPPPSLPCNDYSYVFASEGPPLTPCIDLSLPPVTIGLICFIFLIAFIIIEIYFAHLFTYALSLFPKLECKLQKIGVSVYLGHVISTGCSAQHSKCSTNIYEQNEYPSSTGGQCHF